MTKRIVISIVDGLHYRYLIDTGIAEVLVRANVSLLIFTTPALKTKLESSALGHYTGMKVMLLEETIMSGFRRAHLFIVNNASKKLSTTLNIKNELKVKTSRVHYLIAGFFRLLSGTWLYKGLLKFSGTAFQSPYYRKQLASFNPSLVVLSTPGQKIHDLPLLYEARKRKIKTLSPVYSWDNLTAKGPFVFGVDKLIVWNEIMKQEAIEYHGYNTADVVVAGVPVFDAYTGVMREDENCRIAFLEQFGFTTSLPLITITTIPTIYFGKSHIELARRIYRFSQAGKLPACQILVRPHPLDETDYTPLLALPGVSLDYYGSSPAHNVISKWVPRDDNTIHLARTMKYSDVVINIASTITIDAACFDTPVINIAYDMKEHETEYVGSVARYYNYTHYNHVVNVGAANLVKSDEELVAAIRAYLDHPARHSVERRALVAQQTGRLDGLAYQRVAQVILNAID